MILYCHYLEISIEYDYGMHQKCNRWAATEAASMMHFNGKKFKST